MFDSLIRFVRDQYRTDEFIPLHAPVFRGRERELVLDTIDSTFVSSIGAYVDRFEKDIAEFTASPRAVAVMNGTAALHIALKLADVVPGDLVVTQSLTFVATCNAIAYCSAEPLFVDVDRSLVARRSSSTSPPARYWSMVSVSPFLPVNLRCCTPCWNALAPSCRATRSKAASTAGAKRS